MSSSSKANIRNFVRENQWFKSVIGLCSLIIWLSYANIGDFKYLDMILYEYLNDLNC